MSNQKNLKLLILETNNLTRLTTNSIEANMTGYDYKVVTPGESKIGTALKNIDDITNAIKHVLNNKITGCYNLTSNKSTSLKSLLKFMYSRPPFFPLQIIFTR